MTMPSGTMAGLTLAMALVILFPATARGRDDQKPASQQSEEQEKKKAQEKQQGSTKNPPAPPKNAPLRFTDDDLEAFHKSPPANPDDEEAEEEDEAPGPSATVPAAPTGAVARPPLPPAKVAPMKGPRPVTRPVVRPPGIAPRPQDDPLKPFRDREAKEKFRTEQIQRMRDRLAAIDKQLAYLNSRKTGVLDPLTGMPAPREGDDPKGEAAMRPKELLEKIDLEIKGLEQEKEQVQADLVSIETRFSQETQSR